MNNFIYNTYYFYIMLNEELGIRQYVGSIVDIDKHEFKENNLKLYRKDRLISYIHDVIRVEDATVGVGTFADYHVIIKLQDTNIEIPF